jgi:hypothetical protein
MLKAIVPAALVAVALAALPAQGADQTLSTKIYIVKSATMSKFVSKPVPPVSLASLNPTLAPGGRIRFCIQGGPDAWSFIGLPELNWKALGNPPGSKGFKYKGAGTLADPCKIVLIKANVVKAICKTTDPNYTQPVGGDDGGWEIEINPGFNERLCGSLEGGTIVKDTATLYKGKAAPAPAVCPNVGSPSGAFLAPVSALF